MEKMHAVTTELLRFDSEEIYSVF